MVDEFNVGEQTAGYAKCLFWVGNKLMNLWTQLSEIW
jgi:hypothetical protein